MCDKRFIWNASNYQCECDESFDMEEYVDYQSCKCKKKKKNQQINQLKNAMKVLMEIK